MYPVTKAVAEQFKTNAKQNLSLLVNPVVGESFELTSADILSAGLNINRYSATGDSVALGVCSAADLSLRVENGDGRFNDVVFEGAQIYASVGVEDGNNTQWVPLGYFTVDNAPRRLAVISITALDGMVQFDKLANRSALSLPNSVKNIVLACCNECNITIDTDLDALPNSSFVAQSVGDSEDLTYRTILQWCCQVMGVNGYMDWDGHLELSWYKKDGIPETVSGSIATFESGTEVPVSQLIVNIEPTQDLNGYDSPWVGGAGVNLMPVPTVGLSISTASGTAGNVTGTPTESSTNAVADVLIPVDFTKYTYTYGWTSSAYEYNPNVMVFGYGADKAFIERLSGTGNNPRSIGSGNAWTDYTLIKYVRLRLYNSTNNFTQTETNNANWIMVQGTELPTAWTPYENICPITGKTGTKVFRTGRNIVPNNMTNGTSNGITFTKNPDGSIHIQNTATANAPRTICAVPNGDLSVVDGVKYKFYNNGSSSSTYRVRLSSIIKETGATANWNDYTQVNGFTIDKSVYDYRSFQVYIASGKTVDKTIYPMLEVADIATGEYEPYKGTQYPITFGLEVYGGTLDVVSGVLTVTHVLNTFDGVTTYHKFSSKSSVSTINEYYQGEVGMAHYRSASGTGYATTEDLGELGFWCSYAPTEYKSTSYDVLNANTYWGSSNTPQVRLRLPMDSPYNTVALVNSWLATQYANGTPLQYVYALATPQVYQLTPTQVELLKGINNIWVDGDSTISVTFPAVTEITPADRYNSDIYENAVTITGVSVKGKENQSVVGSEDYALAIDGNPLFTDDDVETIANGLSGLIGFSYHPFSASVLPMPYLYPLDMVAVQYKDEWYDCAITEINFTSTAPTQLKGTGESAQSRSYARINPLTNRERAIIENLKDEMNTTLNKAVNNIIDFNNIISNALGLYHTNVADGSGGFIRYLHDAPDLESSTYIVTETAQGFAWTTNGWNGGTPVWQYGVTSGGYALFKWLSAEGIDVTRASSDYRAEVTPEHFNIYYKSDLIITIDATDRAIQTPRMVIPYSSTSNNSLRVGQLVWLPTPNGANAVVLGS